MTKNGIELLLNYGDTNLARRAISKTLKCLAYNNGKFSIDCIKLLTDNICTVNCRKLPVYLMAIEEIVFIGDNYTKSRIDFFVKCFLQLTTNELVYSYLPYSYLTDLFIKLATKIDMLRKIVKDNPDKFLTLENWLKRYTHPSPNRVIHIKNIDLLGKV